MAHYVTAFFCVISWCTNITNRPTDHATLWCGLIVITIIIIIIIIIRLTWLGGVSCWWRRWLWEWLVSYTAIVTSWRQACFSLQTITHRLTQCFYSINHIHSISTATFQWILASMFLFLRLFQHRTSGDKWHGILQAGVLRVTLVTVSKHWNEHRELILDRELRVTGDGQVTTHDFIMMVRSSCLAVECE